MSTDQSSTRRTTTVRTVVGRLVAGAVATSLLLSALPAQAAPTKPVRRVGPDVSGQPFVRARNVTATTGRAAAMSAAMPVTAPTTPSSIAASTQALSLGQAPRTGVRAGLVRTGTAPVWIGRTDAAAVRRTALRATTAPSPDAVRVTLSGSAVAEQAGVAGALVRLVPDTTGPAGSGGQVAVTVDLDALHPGGSAGWAQRAQLVSLPACSMTTPTRPECRQQTPVETVRDASGTQVTGLVTLGASTGAVVAAAAGPAGGAGDFRASPMSPSGSWTAGGSGGGFSWSYPIRVPHVAGDLMPSLVLAYSSDAVDGRTASTNNQPSWVGEGWELGLGSIERSYRSCEDDMAGGANNSAKRQDLCWAGDNATASFAGHSGQLVQQGRSNEWRLREDDGTRFEKLTGALNSGDNDREYWKVTTTDGTQYFFGRGRASAGTAATEATLVVPVYGNHRGEPCHGARFTGSWCRQAWRWNLDHVVDVHGNSVTAYYAKEVNSYGRNSNETATAYDRASYLTRVDYGQRAGHENATAAARVTFDVAERCLPTAKQTCRTLTAGSADAWPDVPQDQLCSTSSCSNRLAPTFFSRKRLTAIKTSYLSGTAFKEVERWTLAQKFPSPGDGTSASLWLDSITHAGAGGASPLPPVRFGGVQLANRVDGVEDTRGSIAPPLIKWRVAVVDTESSGEIGVAYSRPDCTPKSLPGSQQSNTRRCFPVYWSVSFAAKPSLNWFHKYVVTAVTQHDLTNTASLPTATSYGYVGGAGWTYDDNKFVKAAHRTWSRWNGYAKVRTVVGAPTATGSERTDTTYYRGMDGDRAGPSGGTTSVQVTDSEGTQVADRRAFQGETREEITYDGPSGHEVSGTISDVSALGTTATNADGVEAVMADVTLTRVRTRLSDGAFRRTELRTTYDDHGFVTETDDLGDVALDTDDTCTRTTYSRDVGAWVLDPVGTEQARATRCAKWPASPTATQVLTETRSYYDGLELGAVGRGDLTRTETAKAVDGAGFSWFTDEATTYDALGREEASTDALGRTTRQAYTPAGAGVQLLTTTTSADPDGSGPLAAQVSRVWTDPRWGTPVTTVAADGATTSAAYDALGRITAVWNPGRTRATQTPSTTYAYRVAARTPSAVTTSTLLPDEKYRTSVQLFDGLLRARQTQALTIDTKIIRGYPTDTPGRLVTDTVYDDRGLAIKAQGPTLVSGAPTTSYAAVLEAQVPSETVSAYDGAGRLTRQTLVTSGTTRWSTTTAYGGDRVMVTPPAGGTATTTITDARGRITALRQHTGPTPTGAYDESTYSYTPAGKLASMTDAAGNTWRHGYDLLGREVQTDDPDAGRSTKTYDLADQLTTSTDARGQTVAYTYDGLGRKTSLREGSVTGAVRAAWTYDTVKPGHLASSTRYVNGQPIVSRVTSLDAAGRALASEVSVPVIPGWVDAPLAKTYPTTNTYFPDGSTHTSLLPEVGPIIPERATYYYDALGRQSALGGWAAWVAGATYSGYGDLLQTASGLLNNTTFATWEIDQGTGRTSRVRFDRENAAKQDYDTSYGYNDAGAITKIATSAPESGGATDTQCFSLDHVQRLTAAWTPASGNCATAPTTAGLGGPAPYWQAWTFDKASNLTSAVDHRTTGDTTTSWALPAQGKDTTRPHAATSSTVVAPGTAPVTAPLTYDDAGSVTGRSSTAGSVLKSSAKSESLAYDVEGRLATVRATGSAPTTTSFAYDVDGNRLLRTDADTTTLYLGNDELTLTKATGNVAADRYYSFAGQRVAVRDGVNGWNSASLWSELNGTASWQVDWDNNLAISTKRSLPYGGPRGTASGPLRGQQGFVGGLEDAALGFVRLGARDYDPATSRFLTVDPVLDVAVPQQWNPYGYANGNPVIHPDPAGTEPGDGNSSPGPWSMSHSTPQGSNKSAPVTSGITTYKTFDGVNKFKSSNAGRWEVTDRTGGLSRYSNWQPRPPDRRNIHFVSAGRAHPFRSPYSTTDAPREPTREQVVNAALVALALVACALARSRCELPAKTDTRGMLVFGEETLAQKLDQATAFKGRAMPIEGGPANGYIVKRTPTGEVSNYMEYDYNGFAKKRVDLLGRSHAGIPTPHVSDYALDKAPSGKIYPRELQVRPATADEVPR